MKITEIIKRILDLIDRGLNVIEIILNASNSDKK